jgi:IstB-like ATP binding protein
MSYRHDKRLSARLRYARLRHQAAVEDVDHRTPRGLDRALFQKLVAGDWIDAHDNLAICGPTGIGKSWLACALGHKACAGSCRDRHVMSSTASVSTQIAACVRRRFQPGHGGARLTASQRMRSSLQQACLWPYKPQSHAVAAIAANYCEAWHASPVIQAPTRTPAALPKSS